MKLKKIKNYLLLAVGLVVITSCDKSDPTPTEPTKDDKTILTGDITADKTISKNTTISLKGLVYVKTGVTLTIEEGVKIEAYTEDANIDIIIVERGGKLNAVGTAKNPIIFTSSTGEGKKTLDDADYWGGIVINGYATTNVGATATGEYNPTGTYGGDNDKDNSGTLKYILLKYPGKSFDEDIQLNGLSFYSVGSETTLEYIEVYKPQDDGIEFYGGTASIKHALVVDGSDDAFDWTDGWRGKENTDWWALLGTNSNNGIEADNQSANNDATPVSSPVIKGFHVIGMATDNSLVKSKNNAIYVRRGSEINISDVTINKYAGINLDESTFARYTNKKSSFTNVKIDSSIETKFEGNAADIKNDPEINSSEELAIPAFPSWMAGWTITE